MTEEQGGRRPLNDRDRAVLEFERLVWSYPGAREAEIRERFDLSLTRYSQLLTFLLDHPDAEAYDPTTVRRLRRLRDARARARSGQLAQEDVPPTGPRAAVPQHGVRPAMRLG